MAELAAGMVVARKASNGCGRLARDDRVCFSAGIVRMRALVLARDGGVFLLPAGLIAEAWRGGRLRRRSVHAQRTDEPKFGEGGALLSFAPPRRTLAHSARRLAPTRSGQATSPRLREAKILDVVVRGEVAPRYKAARQKAKRHRSDSLSAASRPTPSAHPLAVMRASRLATGVLRLRAGLRSTTLERFFPALRSG